MNPISWQKFTYVVHVYTNAIEVICEIKFNFHTTLYAIIGRHN